MKEGRGGCEEESYGGSENDAAHDDLLVDELGLARGYVGRGGSVP